MSDGFCSVGFPAASFPLSQQHGGLGEAPWVVVFLFFFLPQGWVILKVT